MNNLTDTEALEFLLLLEGSIDQQFQVWITLTFAAVAAAYLARGHLSKAFAHFMTSVYLLAVAAVIARWLFEVYRIGRLIESHEIVLETFPKWAGITVYFTFSLVAIGTAGCVFCIYHFRQMNADT